jgi:multidrug efflux pump subunit AcrA (membrane-fusion protein)
MRRLFKNKIFLAIVIVAAIIGGYFEYRNITAGNSTTTKYVTAKVERGTFVVSVTGSGQLAALYQIDIKPKVSGEITWIGVSPGDTVRAAQAIMKMDDTDAQQAVISAKQNIETAKLQLQKDTAQAPIDYQKALDALTAAQDSLQTQYNDTFNTLSNTYLDLPGVITGMQDILYGTEIDPKTGQWNVDALINLFSDKDTTKIMAFAKSAKDSYIIATEEYDPSVLAYKQLSRNSSGDQIEIILKQSIDTVTAIAQTLQDELNLLGAAGDLATQYNRSLPTAAKTIQTSARSYLSTINSDLSALLSQKNTIDTTKQAITADKQNIALLQVGNPNGDNPISLQISKNNLVSQEQNLTDLENALSYYTIVAPFDGTIASVSVKRGDTASGAVATIVSDQKYAQATFNETDVVNIRVGQKATITFDALPDLTLTGKVSEVDPVGTVSQGVVSYNVQIALDDVSNTNAKPGMSDTVSIIVNTKQDVLLVPNSAVTTKQGVSYVNVLGTDGTPTQQEVTIGLSNDSLTEIVSGLNEGDAVVTQTVTTQSAASQSSAAGGGLRIPGLVGSGGAFGR